MGAVLVLDDDEGARRLLSRFIGQIRPVRTATTPEDAIAQIGAHDDWSGFLIDVALGAHERGGLDVLAAARRVFPAVPAALVTATNSKEVINRAAALSAMFLCKPFGHEELSVFLERTAAVEAGLDERLALRLHTLARKWDLAPREADILAWLVGGRSREGYLAKTGRSCPESGGKGNGAFFRVNSSHDRPGATGRGGMRHAEVYSREG
jgi:CheY-like chemotaxis protein